MAPKSASLSKSPPGTARTRLQATELVIIKSSAQKGKGPQPRALKRRGEKYMLPKSPQSPTLRVNSRSSESAISLPFSSSHPRKKDCFVSVDVSQLTVEPFSVQVSQGETDSSWSPILSEDQTKAMDVRRAPSFDPSQTHVTSFSLLRALDLFPALGITPENFWSLFSRCRVCNNYMTTRTIPYHQCTTITSSSDLSNTSDSQEMASEGLHKIDSLRLRELDAHIFGNEGGVSEESFIAAFYTCHKCGRYTTRRMASSHKDSEFDKDYTGKCVYLALQQVNSVEELESNNK